MLNLPLLILFAVHRVAFTWPPGGRVRGVDHPDAVPDS